MIVVCKNCDTRFNLRDDKIPAGGAKVRCSCCEHAFHVERPRPDASPGRPEDTQPARSEEPSGLAEDSHLENPEFLYEVDDHDEDEEEAEEGVFGAPAPPAAGPSSHAGPNDDFDLGDVDEPEPDFGEIETDLSVPTDLELASEVEEREREQERENADPMDSWDPFDDGLAAPPPTRKSEPIPVRSGQGLAEEEAEPDEVSELVSEEGPVPRTERRSLRWLTPMLAAIVGAFLIGGGLRTLKLYAIDHEPGPPTVRTTGWVATEIHATHVRDAKGRRVLIIRGKLSSDGTAQTPKVLATLLDAEGEMVGASVLALMSRLEGAALAPEALARRLDVSASSRIIGRVRGFTVLIPDPPEQARRYRVEFRL